MATAERSASIESIILDVLRETRRPFTADELLATLVKRHPERVFSAWDVREASWQLVADRLAELTSDRGFIARSREGA